MDGRGLGGIRGNLRSVWKLYEVVYAGIHGRCMDRGLTRTQDLHRTLATERQDLAGKLVQGPAICGCFNGRNSSDFDAIF